MPAVELTRLVVELFTNIPLKSEDVYSPPKLVALHDLVKSSLFSDKGNLTLLIFTGF